MSGIPNFEFYQFDMYQKEALETAIYPDKGKCLFYPALGLAGEAGEVAEKVKKIYRDKKGEVSELDKEQLILELGDVLWYIAALADEVDICLSEVVEENLTKLLDRKKRNRLGGSGDNR
jgi:NTP pyrophosphatase (non-canonical NTP hydrolase)|tara:strand:- start:186 stop:542 length:357 start_codon:yes stop_codon:yes gene_type:complete